MTVDFLGAGYGFPSGAPGAFTLISGPEKIRQSIEIILATAPGERLMRPDFGCGIHDLVFEPNTAALHGMITARVEEALVRWEPRIDVINVDANTDDFRQNLLLIRIEYRVRQNNALFNLVYPFFLSEGVGFDGMASGALS